MPSPGAVRAGRAFVELFLDKDPLVRGLKSAGAELQKFGASLTAVGTRMMAAGGAILAPLLGAAKTFASTGDQLDKMSARTGVAVESLSELGFAAEQSGASLDQVGGVLQKLNRRFGRITAGEGTATQVDAIKELGLSIDELAGMNPEQRFLAIADAMARYGDDAAAAGLAQRVFGTGVDALLPLIRQGAGGIAELREEAKRLGITMSTEDAKAAAELTDQMNRLWRVLKSVAFEVGAALSEALIGTAGDLMEVGRNVREWVQDNEELIVTAAKAAAAIIGIGGALAGIGWVVSSVGAGLVAMTNPMTLMVVAAGAAAIAIHKLTDASAKLSHTSERALEKGDALRQQHQAHLAELEKLADKERLNNAEMERAESLIATLEGAYGDLGLEVNRTTGQIEGMSDAQKRLNQLMREAARAEATAALEEARANRRELEREQRETGGLGFFEGAGVAAGAMLSGGDERGYRGSGYRALETAAAAEQAALDARIEAARAQERAAQARIDAIAAGEAGSLTGGEPAGAASSGRRPVQTAELGAADQNIRNEYRRLQELRIRATREGLDEEIALIEHRYAEELRIARTTGQQVADIEAARDLEIAEARERSREGLSEEIARLEIEATKEGREKELALLELSRQQELRRDPANADLINRKYDLMAQSKTADAGSQGSAVGTFSAAGAGLLGSAGGGIQQRQLNGIEAIKANTTGLIGAIKELVLKWSS
jgi:TP901 family phage tail tape measure protein